MSRKSVPVGRTNIIGASFALAGALIVSIGIVRAAPVASAPAENPAAIGDPSVEIAAATEPRRVTEVVQVVAEPATAVEAPDEVDRTAGDADAIERAEVVPDVAPVVTDRLVLVGDSLAHEVSPVIRYLTPGKDFVAKFFGGTAPCDWIDVDLEATNSTVVVVSFSGNSMTPCMIDETGSNLLDHRLVEKYRADVGVLIDHATAAGAWVVLVGQPVRHPRFDADLEVEGINAMYQEYAAALPRVSFVDAGRLVEDADGRFTDRLPCLDLDTDCAPDGTALVRSDGIHFCPVVGTLPCPVWSSGATRFGLGIAAAADDPASFD
jgi:hypothetical protein